MFRKMQRSKQQLSREECLHLLKESKRGILSVMGDDGYPYGMPMNHWYCEEDGKLYFHSGLTGHRTDALKRSEKVSFCICDEGWREEGDWALNIRSVIVFGKISFIEDKDRAIEICRKLCYKFTSDEEYIRQEIASAGDRVLCFELIPEHISGKLVNEA